MIRRIISSTRVVLREGESLFDCQEASVMSILYLHDDRIREAERRMEILIESDWATLEDCLAATHEIRLAYEAKAAYTEAAWKGFGTHYDS